MGIVYRPLTVPCAALGAACVMMLGPARADAACNPGTICPGAGTTCTVNTPITVDNGCLLTWSNKNVTVDTGGTIQVASGGSFTIEAGSLVLKGLLSAPAGTITIRALQNLPTFNGQFRTTSAGRVEANGSTATTVGNVVVTGSSVQMDGTSWMRANGTGGSVDICGGTRTQLGACVRSGPVSITSIPADGEAAIVAGGDGSDQITVEGTTITIGTNVSGTNTLLRASAREANQTGGSISFLATTSVTIYGDLEANAFATQNDAGSGGSIDVVTPGPGTITIGSKAVLQAVGGDDPDDSSDGSVSLGEACSVVFAGTMDTNGPTHSGSNEITYRGSLNASGGTGSAGAEGSNTILCRQNAGGTACLSPPTGHPSWNPSLDTVLFPFGPCTGCGNGIVEGTEQCDDGNTSSCDACSPTCTITNPHAACDDGNVCTSPDACDGRGHCTGLRDCDDGNPCTADSCSPVSGCVHGPNNCAYVPAGTFTSASAQVGTPDGQPLAATATRIAVRSSGSDVNVIDATSGVFQYNLNDPDATDFGYALAGVGPDLLVGVPGTLADRGEVRVFAASNGAFLNTIANPSTATNTAWFGFSLAANGANEAIVGVPLDDTTGDILKGAAFRTNLAGSPLAGFFAPAGTPVECVGWSVAALNGLVAVGGPCGTGPTYNEVLVFAQSGGTPLRIPSNQGDPYDQFGQSVGLMSSASAAPGAQGTPRVLVSDDDGTAKAFAYDASTGALVHTFLPANGSEAFGYPVAGVAGNALVGVQGPVEVRLYRGTDWTQLQSLTPPSGSGYAVVAVRGADILVGSNTGVVVYKTRCGNGQLDPGEQCDDGNTRDDDCCTSNCTVAPIASLCNAGSPCQPGACLGAQCLPGACLSGVPCGGGGTCGPPGSCTCQ